MTGERIVCGFVGRQADSLSLVSLKVKETLASILYE